MFHYILRHLRPFVGGQALDLLNDFCRTHNLISRQNPGKVKRVKSGTRMRVLEMKGFGGHRKSFSQFRP
jgi:hypothetical protein